MIQNTFYYILSIILLSIITLFSVNLGLINLSVDSKVFIDLANLYIDNSTNFISIIYDKNFHVIFLYLLEINNLNLNLYYFINIFFLSWTLLLTFNIIDLLIDKNKINQVFISKILVIFFSCFLP